MNWLVNLLKEALFPQLHNQEQELAHLRSKTQYFKDSDAKKDALITSLTDLLGEKKRLTLDDIELKLNEKIILQSCDAAFRHALYKSGEHICLTAYPECCRKTAVSLREYQRSLTLSEKNRIPIIDDTPMEIAEKRSKQFFKSR